MKPRLLDLFCGAGGATKGYQDAGFHVVGVDKEYQPNYCGDAFIQMDAIEMLARGGSLAFSVDEFDAIHASPPCQRYSRKTRNPEKHPHHIPVLRKLLIRSGKPWVIENVEGAPLNNPIKICGSSFGLQVRRHRLFETNWDLMPPLAQCSMHSVQDSNKQFILYDHGKWFRSGVVHVFGTGGGKGKEYWPVAMGMGETWDDCWMEPKEMVEAIPPAYTRWIGNQLISHLNDRSNDPSPGVHDDPTWSRESTERFGKTDAA